MVLEILPITEVLEASTIRSPEIKPPVVTVIKTLELLILEVITPEPILVLLVIGSLRAKLPKELLEVSITLPLM